MTWEPKNGLNDEDVDVSDEEEGDNSFTREEKPNALGKKSTNFAKSTIRAQYGLNVWLTWRHLPCVNRALTGSSRAVLCLTG